MMAGAHARAYPLAYAYAGRPSVPPLVVVLLTLAALHYAV
jgi:hypothetical protein